MIESRPCEAGMLGPDNSDLTQPDGRGKSAHPEETLRQLGVEHAMPLHYVQRQERAQSISLWVHLLI
jgi:hypothetical protein